MSDEQYYVQMEKISVQEKTLIATLTREAVTRAKLQRQEIPFMLEDGEASEA